MLVNYFLSVSSWLIQPHQINVVWDGLLQPHALIFALEGNVAANMHAI